MKKVILAGILLSSVLLGTIITSATENDSRPVSELGITFTPALLTIEDVQAPSFGSYTIDGKDTVLFSKSDLVIEISDSHDQLVAWEMMYTFVPAAVASEYQDMVLFRIGEGTLTQSGDEIANYSVKEFEADHVAATTDTLVSLHAPDETKSGTYEYRVPAGEIEMEFPGELTAGDYGAIQLIQLYDVPKPQ